MQRNTKCAKEVSTKSTKVMEMPKCTERKDLLMIQKMQAHQSSTLQVVSWACKAASRTGSPSFTDYFPHDGSIMNLDV